MESLRLPRILSLASWRSKRREAVPQNEATRFVLVDFGRAGQIAAIVPSYPFVNTTPRRHCDEAEPAAARSWLVEKRLQRSCAEIYD